MFHNHLDLCDIVSLVLWCREDDTFLIVSDELGYWIPSAIVENGVPWRTTANTILNNLSCEGEITKCCKIYRIWKPFVGGDIHHVVFTVEVLLRNKWFSYKNNRKYDMIWCSCEAIQQSYEKLRSPEILDFISSIKNTCLQRPKLTHPYFTYPEGPWTKLIGDNPLNNFVEILECHVFPDIEQSAYQTLLQTSGFTRCNQLGLYAQFLVSCLPCTYMNSVIFTKLMERIGWDEKKALRFFISADIFQEGFLSYRDMLYALAAAEPYTAHSGKAGELRARYIFRYYDMNCDNVLDVNELSTMVDDIVLLKKNSITPRAVCRLTNVGGSDLAINVKVFLELVGCMGVRGTSLLLRSPISITSICPQIEDNIRFVKPVPEITTSPESLTTRVVTFFPPPDEMSHLSSTVQSAVRNTNSGSDFGVEFHCVTLAVDGNVIDIDSPDSSQRRSSLGSSVHNPITNRRSYATMYKTEQEDLLRSVQYFIQEVTAHDESNSEVKEKPSFNWGKINPSIIANSLLKVCEGVSRILSMERRLVELKPPVSVLGELRGNFCDLLCFEKAFWNLGPTLSPTTLLFLGDYVDHGPHGVEVIAYLFARKMESPEKIILLRGSHEIRVLQQTFFNNCCKLFGETLGRKVWEAVNSAMDCMPLAAIIDHKVFCSHGGIPPPWLCPVVSIINKIPCPLAKPDKQSPLAWELIWNEPLKKSDVSDTVLMELDAKEGFATNPSRGTGHLFDVRALKTFLSTNGLSLLLRAREKKDTEFSSEMKELMLTLSCPGGNAAKNDAPCVLVYPGKTSSFQTVLNE